MEKVYTIDDLMQAIKESGRSYDTDRIMAAYQVASSISGKRTPTSPAAAGRASPISAILSQWRSFWWGSAWIPKPW